MEPVKGRVEVLTYTLTSRILLDDDNSAARGVQVERFGKTLQYFASHEVILSAGAIGSPQGSSFIESIGMLQCKMSFDKTEPSIISFLYLLGLTELSFRFLCYQALVQRASCKCTESGRFWTCL